MATGLTVREHYNAPPEQVFAVASDFHNAEKNITAITKCEVVTDGPIGVGSKFRETRVMFGREHTEEMEITTFDPPNIYAVDAESCGCRYHTEFRFTRNGSGTDLEMRFEAEPLTFFAKVMSVLMRPMLKKITNECAKDLNDIKKIVESNGG